VLYNPRQVCKSEIGYCKQKPDFPVPLQCTRHGNQN
jgi:hypothetical protein